MASLELKSCPERSASSLPWRLPETADAADVRVFRTPSCCRLFQLAFAPGGTLFAAGGADGKAWVWDLAGGRRTSFLLGTGLSVRTVGFARGGRFLVVGGGDWLRRTGRLAVWDLDRGAEQADLWRHDRPVTALAVAPDGHRLAAAGGDGRLRLWDLSADGAPVTVPAHDDEVLAVAFSADGRWLATAGADRTVSIWDAGLRRQQTLRGHDQVVRAVAFAAEAVVSADERCVRIWDAESGQLRHRCDVPHGGLRGLAVAPGGRTLFTAANPPHGQAEVRAWTSGGGMQLLHRQPVGLTALACADDSATLAVADEQGTVRLRPLSA